MIADVTFNYKEGDKIPRIEYTPEEISTWDAVYSKVTELIPGRASSIYRKYLTIMESECGFGLGQIPQLEDVSNFLKSRLNCYYLQQKQSFLHFLHFLQGPQGSGCDQLLVSSRRGTSLQVWPSEYSSARSMSDTIHLRITLQNRE